MLASVIIITKDQKKLLQKTIPILKSQAKVADIEIIVVDSGSSDGSVEYCKEQKLALVEIAPENFNYAGAFNKGASVALGDYLVRLSGDAIPLNEDFLYELLLPFSDPMVGATYGKYTISGAKGYDYPDYWPSKRFPNELVRYHIDPGFLYLKNILKGEMGELFNLAGGACAIRRSILEKRHFNERVKLGEDAEYSVFLHHKGYDIVFNPKALVLHEHRVENTMRHSLKRVIKVKGKNIRNWVILISMNIKYYLGLSF